MKTGRMVSWRGCGAMRSASLRLSGYWNVRHYNPAIKVQGGHPICGVWYIGYPNVCAGTSASSNIVRSYTGLGLHLLDLHPQYLYPLSIHRLYPSLSNLQVQPRFTRSQFCSKPAFTPQRSPHHPWLQQTYTRPGRSCDQQFSDKDVWNWSWH